MEKEEILNNIRKGIIKTLSIDTNIFCGYNFHFNRTALHTLKQCKNGKFNLIISDIVSREVIKKMVELGTRERNKLKKIDFSQLTTEDEMACLKKIIKKNKKYIENSVTKKWDEYCSLTGASILKSNNVSIEDLFNIYFSEYPPFKNKKSEFPDAAALISLENWAKKNSQKMIVVSNDNDWKEYCNKSDVLFCIRELSEALDLFNHDEPLIDKIINKKREIIDRLNDYLSNNEINVNIDFYCDLHFEEDDRNITYKIDDSSIDLKLIESEGDIVTVEASFEAKITIELWLDIYLWDNIDKEHISAGIKKITENKNVKLAAFIKLIADNSDFNINSIEILDKIIYLDLGGFGFDFLCIEEQDIDS